MGEPFHDVVAVRKVALPASNDCRDFILDHQDMIDRLSVAPYGGEVTRHPNIEILSPRSGALLKNAVLLHVAEFRKAFSDANDCDKDELRAFLKQAGVTSSKAWLTRFQAKPPRGTLSRVARRCGVELHESSLKHNYGSQKDLKREIRRLRTWYRPGRKASRSHGGIRRSKVAPRRVKGLRSVWNKKVAQHYRRLLKPLRIEGLWRWRSIALSLHRAGMPVQSGTIPVERLRASLGDMLPAAARLMTPEWFQVLASLAYLRYNYRHFHHRLLPSWTESDSLLAERIGQPCGCCAGSAKRCFFEVFVRDCVRVF